MKEKNKMYLLLLIPIWTFCFFIGFVDFPLNIVGYVLWMIIGSFVIIGLNICDGTIKLKKTVER